MLVILEWFCTREKNTAVATIWGYKSGAVLPQESAILLKHFNGRCISLDIPIQNEIWFFDSHTLTHAVCCYFICAIFSEVQCTFGLERKLYVVNCPGHELMYRLVICWCGFHFELYFKYILLSITVTLLLSSIHSAIELRWLVSITYSEYTVCARYRFQCNVLHLFFYFYFSRTDYSAFAGDIRFTLFPIILFTAHEQNRNLFLYIPIGLFNKMPSILLWLLYGF